MQLSQILLPIACLTLLLSTLVDCAKDYYQLLGIERGATDRQIKRAFRKLAVKYHPDKNKDPDAEKIFVDIAKAYEVLQDPEKRKQYDQLGHSAFEEQETKFGSGGGAGGFGNFNLNDFFKQFDESLKFFQTGKKHGRNGGRGSKFNFGDDFWDDLDNDDLFGGFGNFGFNGGFGDTFINLHDFGFGGDLFGKSGGNKPKQPKQGGKRQFTKQATNRGNGGGKNCRTVTKKFGNTITTYTDCS
ncbi:dnaJ homolog subfamily B member 9-like [Amphiura filiformis]|uniref:dnaJ homolog subfamily B member 9-like n=1 Tax=Amphiura filiformis TaxID=82378 RepID=UPI003B20CDFC